MGLTGISDDRHTPGSLREFVFSQGASSGGGPDRDVLIYGPKTSAGSETVNVIGVPIASAQDCIDRFGRRSIAHLMYRYALAADPGAAGATYRIVGTTEPAGNAAFKTITFANGAATDATSAKIEFIGESTTYSIALGDTAVVQAAAFVAAFNAADSGNWPATAAIGGGGSEHIVTVTAANLGEVGDYILGNGTNISLRHTYAKNVTTTATISAITVATAACDHTLTIAEAANGEYYYHCSPMYQATGPTATDNGVGELIAMIQAGNLPASGKSQQAIFGLVGTQANATTVGTDTDANNVFVTFVHAKNSDWCPGVQAAHMTGLMRSAQAKHPSANLAGYANGDATPFRWPAPYSNSNRLTAVEIESDLKDGVTPIAFNPAGGAYIVRHVTSRNLNAQGSKDYRAHEGHIPSAAHAFWARVKLIMAEQKQPFVDSDPAAGQKPQPNTWYPQSIKAIVSSVIDDFCGPAPLGRYVGPILKQSAKDAMKASIVATKIPGGISVVCDIQAVEHYLHGRTTINETGGAY